MKKYIFSIAILSIVPSVAFASWWNPATWFQSPSGENNQSVQQLTQQFSTTTEATSTISIINQSVATTSQAMLQSEINMLTMQNNSLQSKLNSIESQLALAQKNYSMCQVSLTAAQNTNTASQVQQPTIAPTVPTVAPSTASISADYNNPIAHTVSAVSGQYPSLPILTFDIAPSNNNQTLGSVTVNINNSGQGTVNTAYLYVSGFSTSVATAVVSNGSATFSDIRSIPSLSTNASPYDTFTVKVDVSGLTDVGSSESVSASVSNVTITDSAGHGVNVTGTAQGKVITVTNDSTADSLNSGSYPFNLTEQEVSTPGTYTVSTGGSSYSVTVYPDGLCSQSRGPCTEVGGGWSCTKDGCGG